MLLACAYLCVYKPQAMKDGNGGIHWYGKASSRSGRKMAHVTFCGSSAAAVQRSAEAMKVAVVS